MYYPKPDKDSSTIIIRMMCAIVFVLFTWGWLYFFQADALAMTQHVLSGGLTHYNRLVGAIIITAVLMILQYIVNGVTKLNKRFHALTYVPSMLLLAMLTDVSQTIDKGISLSRSFGLVAFFAVAWVVLIFFVRQYENVVKEFHIPFFSRSMWLNMLMMVAMITCVAWIGNTNAVFQYRMKVEGHLMRGEYHEYPITGNSSQILPTSGKTKMLLCPTDSIYKFMGARPAVPMEPERYLAMLQRRDSVNHIAIADYLLCGYLIDKQLDRFAQEISHYYPLNAQLPKHYREALTLYTHSRSNPSVVYQVPEVEENYANYQELKKQYRDPMEQKTRVSEEYRGTYWYFYDYE